MVSEVTRVYLLPVLSDIQRQTLLVIFMSHFWEKPVPKIRCFLEEMALGDSYLRNSDGL